MTRRFGLRALVLLVFLCPLMNLWAAEGISSERLEEISRESIVSEFDWRFGFTSQEDGIGFSLIDFKVDDETFSPRQLLGVDLELWWKENRIQRSIALLVDSSDSWESGYARRLRTLLRSNSGILLFEEGNDTITDQEIKVFAGRDYVLEQMEGLQFKIGPKSFYQTNSEQAYELYKVTRDFAELTGDETVYDLYTGTGTIANFVAKKAKKVVGIEYVPEAIEDAKINSEINNIENTRFFAGDMKDVLNETFIREHGTPEVVITDPPRAGMHADVIETILKMQPHKIIYVSCNPATQARDLAMLDSLYQIEKIQPVDMFPHTHHVENVVLLRKRLD